LSSLLLAGTRGTHRRGPGRRPGPPAPRAAAANTHTPVISMAATTIAIGGRWLRLQRKRSWI